MTVVVTFDGAMGMTVYSFVLAMDMGMTAPMAVLALVSWLRHPYKGNKAEVATNRLCRREIFGMFLLSVPVTAMFYCILAYFRTANMIPSTLSITTSFIAVYLTWRRSPYFALAYAANDIVLIVLWTLAAAENITYISVIICFVVFLANDLYGFISWKQIERRQAVEKSEINSEKRQIRLDIPLIS